MLGSPGAGLFTAKATTSRAAVAKKKGRKHGRPRSSTLAYGSGSASAAGAGTMSLKVQPSAAARKALRRARRFTVALSIAFQPTGGSPHTERASVAVHYSAKKMPKQRPSKH